MRLQRAQLQDWPVWRDLAIILILQMEILFIWAKGLTGYFIQDPYKRAKKSHLNSLVMNSFILIGLELVCLM